MCVEGDDLIEKNVVKRLGKNTAFVVTDVEFEPGPLGGRELCISWNDLNDYIRIQVYTCSLICTRPLRSLLKAIAAQQGWTTKGEDHLQDISLLYNLCSIRASRSVYLL